MTRASFTVVELKPTPHSAEGWCARLNADDVTPADRAAFAAWLAASPENRADYELSALVCGVSRGLQSAHELRSSFSVPSRVESVEVRPRAFRQAAIAAGVAVLICASAFSIWRFSAATYATDIGEQKRVSLEDGSVVQLNTSSAMNVDLGKEERHVTLRRGEAFFSVSPDASRPFIVKAGNSEIRVVGTKFNVRMDGETARITVVEGHVKVLNPSAAVAAAGSAPVIDVLSGQGASVTSERPAVKLDNINAGRLTSWREGKIYFEQEPLSKVLDEVNRYTASRFLISDANNRNLKLSGVFRIGDTDSVAFALREAYGLKAERDGDRIVIR